MQICSQCKMNVPDGVKFCPSCGKKIESEQPTNTQQPIQQTTMQNTTQPTTAQTGVISTLVWLGVLILFAIPLIGLIVYIFWAFGAVSNQNLRNFARASLILTIIGIVLSTIIGFVLYGVVGPIIGNIMQSV